MLMAETLFSVSSSTVVKIYITFCDFKLFCSVPQRVCVFVLFTDHTAIFFSGSNRDFIPSEAEIYLIS